VYAFDTGFSCYYRGWHELRGDDLGTLWEHFVLNEVMAHSQMRQVFYWRDKRGHEVDLVWAPRGAKPLAVECKWSADEFEAAGITALRRQYPQGENVVVAQDVERAFVRNYGDLKVHFEALPSLVERIAGAGRG
jgi:predicted AAA+ superfamily ATPase